MNNRILDEKKNERKRQKKKKASKNRLAKRRGEPAPRKNVPKLYEKRRGETTKWQGGEDWEDFFGVF